MNDVRQCRIEGHRDLGAVAVRVEAEPGTILWGTFHPAYAGRWADDDTVVDIESNWTPMIPETTTEEN